MEALSDILLAAAVTLPMAGFIYLFIFDQ